MATFNNLSDLVNADKIKVLNAVKNTPRIIATLLQNNFSDNFTKESFNGEKWKRVKKHLRKKKYRKKPILFNTGHLAESILVKKATWNEIIIVSDMEYSKKHNEGIGVPKRQFMGHGKDADKIIRDTIEEEFDFTN